MDEVFIAEGRRLDELAAALGWERGLQIRRQVVPGIEDPLRWETDDEFRYRVQKILMPKVAVVSVQEFPWDLL